jgi:hypothetical protein
VTTALTTLGTDDIGTELETLLDVLDVANHVHIVDASLVKLVDDGLRRHTNGGNKEFGTGLDDRVDELVQLTLGIIVATVLVS